jgi:hypothetical protein
VPRVGLSPLERQGGGDGVSFLKKKSPTLSLKTRRGWGILGPVNWIQ